MNGHSFRKKYFRIICFSLFMASSLALFAQDGKVENWTMYFGNKKIKKKFNWHSEIQLRDMIHKDHIEQLLVRTGFGYDLTANNNNVLIGYGYVRTVSHDSGYKEKNVLNENRIYQQFITRQEFGRVYLQHRYRIEERFFDGKVKDQLRFRYFLGIVVPVNKEKMVNGAIYLSMFNELFLKTVGNAYDRTRLYGGIGYRFNETLRVEAGYMNHFFQNSSRDQINLMFFLTY